MQAGAGGLDLGRQIGQPLGVNLMVIDALAVVGQAAAVLERLVADSLERVNDQAGLFGVCRTCSSPYASRRMPRKYHKRGNVSRFCG